MLIAWLAACTGTDKDSNEAPPLKLDDSGATCSSEPPTIDTLTVTNGGTITGEGGDPQPSVEVDVTFFDNDLDVDVINMRFWWDTPADGAVDTTGAAGHETGAYKIDPDGEPCHVSGGTLQQRFGVTGTTFEFNTWYDFAVTVTDAHELTSAVATASGVTPKEDGSDGDPR